ncbi:PIR protein [Plasmodium reichenowi]|uniref:PIR protein n=1 Tax=Plasmodium reichenowi TaxID=5854 RepID=A0A2P9DSM7_PLARE|nr:PIR protein [Plasmodium reichenowi]
MKLHYTKILLFFFALNILVTSLSNEHNKNKPYITTRHTQSNRSLCECEIQSSIYDKDADIKSVKENFHRQTSQRLREYDERMQEKRQKSKEQRDKNIQKIINKDKMEKNLAEKIEKGCLKCGCALGGVAASVGIIGPVAIGAWKNAATAAAMEYATKKGIEEGVKTVIAQIKGGNSIFNMLTNVEWRKFITESYYSTVDGLVKAVTNAVDSYEKTCTSPCGIINQVRIALPTWQKTLGPYVTAGKDASSATTKSVQTAELAKVGDTSYAAYSAIGYSVLAILIIVLVMVIIYLILRYRRKKKMNKKVQYTKLLNQ